MSSFVRLRGAVALVLACVLGGWGIGSIMAGAAIADDAPGPTPAPVTVVIPDLSGQTPTPTPTPSSSSSPSSTTIARTGGRDGSGKGDAAVAPHRPDTEPSIPKRPAVGTLTVQIAGQGVFGSGSPMMVTAKGFDPAEKVQVVLYYEHQKPIRIGNFAADASGSFARTFVLPQLDAGTDTVQLTGWDSSKIGTGRFLLGASWIAPHPDSQRAIWLWLGGLTGLGAFAALVWFGIASLRRVAVAEAGV
jgi:hypothetical protein